MTATADAAPTSRKPIRSLVPARMDRLPWTRFHWLVVCGLGVSWILDGLEIQLVSLIQPILTQKGTLELSSGQAGFLASMYLIGEVVGALVFGRLTDKLGRKNLFIVTLAIYLIGSGLGGLSWNYWSLLLLRFVAGTGIGGEYTAINAAIDELIPSYYRGRVDIAVNGTYWAGAAIGSALGLYLFSSHVPIDWGWRIAFFIGPLLGLVIIFLRRSIPESPRWQMTHGYAEQAERTVDEIEHRIEGEGVQLTPVDDSKALEITESPKLTLVELTKVFFGTYPKRSAYGFMMMVTQAFLFNAIFFSYALVLSHFYKVPDAHIPYYFFPFAAGNLLGPLLLGRLFDVVGRRKMILATYGISGILLLVSAWMFYEGSLSAVSQTVFWCVIFFFASAGASSAYLTVSEIFPVELRGQAISYFFALSQAAGGVVAPWLFGHLIGGAQNAHPDRTPLAWGYVIGAVIMLLGAITAWTIGVDSERKSLEDVANPLSAGGSSRVSTTPGRSVMAVVVGVSPTTGSPAALRWAAEEARLRGLPMRAVMAWRAPTAGGAGTRPPAGAQTPGEAAGSAAERLRSYVDHALGFPADVECRVVRGSAAAALLTAAGDAHLLVIGEPRPGRLGSVRTGLVAPQVVLGASCPVVVMPATGG